jgi:hypothetical protein
MPVQCGSELFLFGDFNICWGRQECSMYKSYSRILNSLNCKQIITEATRVTENCSNILDHIVTSESAKVKNSGVLNCGLSDHQIIFCTRGAVANVSFTPIIQTIRSLKNYSKQILCTE